MNSHKSEKSTGPHGYIAVRPPNRRQPGHRDAGSSGSGPQGRTGHSDGRGSFSGSPPGMGASTDWGSPHKTSRISSTGRGK